MKNALRQISLRDRRVWPLLAILLAGLSLSGYKMVDAFTGDHSNPEYKSTPSSAFAVRPPDTIIDPAKLTEPRLPDEVYSSLLSDMKKVVDAAVVFKLTEEDLTDRGMSKPAAEMAIVTLDTLRQQVTGGEGQYQPIQITSVTGQLASLAVNVTYNVDGVQVAATITGEYAVQGTDTRLQSLQVEAGGLGAEPAPPTTPSPTSEGE